jgi:Flp pilus assembly pilin Flp
VLARNEAGAVFAEYVTILVLVSIGCAAATVALGLPLQNLYVFQQAVLLLPIP